MEIDTMGFTHMFTRNRQILKQHICQVMPDITISKITWLMRHILPDIKTVIAWQVNNSLH